MFKNYIKIAFRNILKKKAFSSINIIGLAFGMTCVILIMLYVKSELSYDKFHQNADNIYRVAWFDESPQTRTPHPMAQAMANDFPEVIAATSISPLWGPGLTQRTFSIWNPNENEKFDEKGILSVDSTFFNVFSFELVKGNKEKVLKQVGGILLSERMAQKYFGNENPIGKTLAINNDKVLTVVEGVFTDVPENSHFHFDFLISYVTLKAMDPDSEYYTWADFGHFNYVKLANNSNPKTLEDKLLPWLAKYINFTDEQINLAIANNEHFGLQRLTDIHLNSHIRWELEQNGNIEYIYIMTAAAILILLIACINFINLTTARSTERAREIGVRKSLGAEKRGIIFQFIGESTLTVFLALLVAGLLVEILLSVFNDFTGKSLEVNYFDQPELILVLIGSAIIIGFLSGLYPAFFLSSIKPINSLKGPNLKGLSGNRLRKSMVVFQFIVAMVLITGGVVITSQLDFLRKREKGFNEQGVIVVPIKNYELISRFEAIKAELSKIAGIEYVSASSSVPGSQFNNNHIFLTNDTQVRTQSSELYIEADFLKTLGLEIVAGRSFDKDDRNDWEDNLIINETAAKQLGLIEPIGAQVSWNNDLDSIGIINGTIIGVLKDFNFQSLHVPIRPLIVKQEREYNQFIIKVNANNPDLVTSIESIYKQFEPNFQFEYTYLSDDLAFQYRGEAKTAYVFDIFSGIAITIACLGLYALAILSYSQRLKEISIRKVMGANMFSLIRLLLTEYTGLILLSVVIGLPLSYFLADSWLQNFTYRMDLQFSHFLISGMLLISVAWVTLSYLSIKTSRINPIDSLKEE